MMNCTSLKKMLVVGVAIVGLSLCTAPADAGWWGCGWSCCGSCGGCGGCGCYYGCGGWGCHHRWGCGWGCGCGCGYACGCGCGCDCGWSCCDSCCSVISCCDTCCGGCCGGAPLGDCGCGGQMVPAMPAVTPGEMPMTPPVPPTVPSKPPVAPTSPSNTPPAVPGTGIPGTTAPTLPEGGGLVPPTPNRTSIEPNSEESGVLTVWVPYEAKVTINGMLTKSTGSKRHFVSYGLRPGFTYKYVVKAEVVREGKTVTESQTVTLDRGRTATASHSASTCPVPKAWPSTRSQDRRGRTTSRI